MFIYRLGKLTLIGHFEIVLGFSIKQKADLAK